MEGEIIENGIQIFIHLQSECVWERESGRRGKAMGKGEEGRVRGRGRGVERNNGEGRGGVGGERGGKRR